MSKATDVSEPAETAGLPELPDWDLTGGEGVGDELIDLQVIAALFGFASGPGSVDRRADLTEGDLVGIGALLERAVERLSTKLNRIGERILAYEKARDGKVAA